MPILPSTRAFFGTFATGVATQALTLVTGALTARLLGPEGRGQFAGAQVWPGIVAMLALFGINNALSIRAARDRGHKAIFEQKALKLGLPLSVLGAAIGWFAMPWLVPASNPELLWLSRVMLIQVPLFALTSNLMAIDQGCGDFKQFNVARNILTPVYLVLLVTLWLAGVREVIWFLGALLTANFAVLIYRLIVVKRDPSPGDAPANSELFRSGFPFWISGGVSILRDNAERLLLMFLLGPSALGFYTVAFTASGAHLNISRSLNLIVFSRSAALGGKSALADAARFFRMMGLMNVALGIIMVVAMPLLIHIIFGPSFAGAVKPAMLLVMAQLFLSQGAILDEALRAQSRPYVGLIGMVCGMTVFAAVGSFIAKPLGLLGVAGASIAGQFAFWLWMVVSFRRIGGDVRLFPNRHDVAQLVRIASETKEALFSRLRARPAP